MKDPSTHWRKERERQFKVREERKEEGKAWEAQREREAEEDSHVRKGKGKRE